MQSVKISIVRNLFRIGAMALIASLAFVTLPNRPVSGQKSDGGITPETVFSNPANIDINTASAAATLPLPWSPYPSTIPVSGMTGNITKLTVSLNGLNDPRPTNFDALLVGPTGANLIIASDIGNSNSAVTDVTLTFDDAAAAIANLTGPVTSTVRPTNLSIGNADTFPAPAPAGPYNSPAQAGSATFASIFNGTDPNGDWKLFIVLDETSGTGAAGYLANGWSLQVTTSGSPATRFSNSSIMTFNDVVAPATPYPSIVDVSGMAGVVSNIKVTLTNFSHPRPADVQVLLVSPNGRGLVLMANIGSNVPVTNATITFDDAATGGITTPIVSGSFRPGQTGTFSFPAPAPPPPYAPPVGNQLTDTFGKFSPNGQWSLYVADNVFGQSGSISGGWSLDITTTPNMPLQFGCSAANFLPPAGFPAGTGPTGLASADFNGDTKPDLAVANQSSNNVSILLNDGSGGFNAATNFTAGTAPYQVATGRFNADAFDDLVVVNGGSNNLSILLGDGLGGFGSPTNFAAGPNPISVTIADFNGDSKQDLGVADFGGFFAGTVAVLLGTGTGSFGAPALFGARTQPAAIAAGDFNGDTKQDLAVANFGSNNISILLGSGTGTFTYSSTLAAGTGPVSLIVMDHNGDGKLDLSFANYNGNNAFGYLGVGDGTFVGGGPAASSLNSPVALAYGDITNDGQGELMVANSGSNLVSLASSVVFQTVTMGTGPFAIVTRDFDGDGRLDIATANNGDNNVTVTLNRCFVARGNRFDFDSDRRTDNSVFRPSVGTWFTITASGSISQDVFGGPLDRVVAADYNGDGRTDYGIFRAVSGVWTVRQVSSNVPFLNVQFGLATDVPVPADYDGDGKADIAIFRPSDGSWYIRQSSDNSLRSMMFGATGDLPAPGDFDGDGKADLAIFRPSSGGWYIFQSQTSSVLGVTFGTNGDRPVADDYDGDGKADIAVYRNGDWYYLQSSDGGFGSAGFGMAGDIPVPGDYDRDGKFDFAIYRPSTATWYMHQSTTGSFTARQWGNSTDIPVPSSDVP